MKKVNCWEYMKCGCEPGGNNTQEQGTCPAATAKIYQGVNGGVQAGRFCWKIVGTMCFDAIKGKFAQEITSCMQCPFFIEDKEEEGISFE